MSTASGGPASGFWLRFGVGNVGDGSEIDLLWALHPEGGRRVQATISLAQVILRLDGTVIADHARSWVPAGVVVVANPAHLQALREHRHAHGQLQRGDVAVPVPNLAALDALVGAF